MMTGGRCCCCWLSWCCGCWWCDCGATGGFLILWESLWTRRGAGRGPWSDRGDLPVGKSGESIVKTEEWKRIEIGESKGGGGELGEGWVLFNLCKCLFVVVIFNCKMHLLLRQIGGFHPHTSRVMFEYVIHLVLQLFTYVHFYSTDNHLKPIISSLYWLIVPKR